MDSPKARVIKRMKYLRIIVIAAFSAMPLAFIAVCTKQEGLHGFLTMFAPISCAWMVGRMTALGEWERKFDADFEKIKSHIDKQDEDD